MPSAQLATEYANRSGGPRQSLCNMYVEKTTQGPRQFALRGRPGLVSVTTLGEGPVYWVEYAGGARYVQSGNAIFRNNGQIATVMSGGTRQVTKSESQLVFTSGNRAYVVEYLDTPSTVSTITDPSLPDVSGVIFGPQARFYFPNTGTGQFHYSAIGDATTIDDIGFANAEADPDPITRGAMCGGSLLWFGEETIENHQGTTDIAEPTVRVKELTANVGCYSPYSISALDNGRLFFVGNDEAGVGVYTTEGGHPQRISTATIDEALESATEGQIAEITGCSVVREGHSWYVISIPGQTSFAYDVSTKLWAEWASYDLETFRLRTGNNGVFGDGTGGLWTFSGTAYADGTDPLVRVCSAFLAVEQRQRCSVLTLECSTGVGTPTGQGSDPVVEHRYTDEVTGDWTDWMAADLGAEGDRMVRASWWQEGLMEPPGRYQEFRCSDPVPFVCNGLSVNERP